MTTLSIPTARVYQPLLAPARYKGAKGGRGSGKSHFYADTWLDENVRQKLDVVCLRETLKSLEFSVKKLLEGKVEKYNAGSYFDVQDRRILSKKGGVTIFEGMQNHTADSIKSLEDFDRAWFEEAHRASQKSIDLLRPTIRKPDSELWFSWNPENATDPIEGLLSGEQLPPGAVVVKANYTDNPWLPDVLREEIEYDRSRDPDKFAHVWLGEYQRNSQARVFKNWTVEEFDVPADAVIRQGADWGFSIDPTVLIQCYMVGRKLYIPHEAYRVGCEIVDIPELFLSLPEAEKWPLTADSARPETISHVRKHGFSRILPAVKGARSVEEGVEFLQSYDIVVHPRCKYTIQELTLYSYKVDDLTGLVLPVLADKDNHVIDALRYACEGVRRTVKRKKEETHRPIVQAPAGRAGWLAA